MTSMWRRHLFGVTECPPASLCAVSTVLLAAKGPSFGAKTMSTSLNYSSSEASAGHSLARRFFLEGSKKGPFAVLGEAFVEGKVWRDDFVR